MTKIRTRYDDQPVTVEIAGEINREIVVKIGNDDPELWMFFDALELLTAVAKEARGG